MATVIEQDVLEALKRVTDPDRGTDIVSLGMVAGLVVKEGNVGFSIEVEPERGAQLEPLRQAAESAVDALPGVLSVNAVLTAERATATPPQQAPTGGQGRSHAHGQQQQAAPPAPGVKNIVAVKESAPDTRRFTDFRNAFGDRYVLFAGLDDVALEGLYLGAQGWVSGLTNAFPKESVELVAAFERGDHAKAMEIYRWFMPLLHLDAEHDLVQSIKLAEQVMGRGSERVLPPRYVLEGARRAEVIAMVEKAAATRPTLGLSKAA